MQRADEETTIFDHTFFVHAAGGERHEQFASTIGEVLRLGWTGHFAAAQSVLVALRDARATSPGERAVCNALLALASVARGELSEARRLLRQALCKPAAQPPESAAAELHWLRLARALAVHAGAMVGNTKRARSAAQAKFLASDPDSAWLIAWRAGWSWRDAPIAVQRHARFVAAVHARHEARRPGLL